METTAKNIYLDLKQRSFLWQLTTLFTTTVLNASFINLVLISIFILIFKSSFFDFINTYPPVKTLIEIICLVPATFLSVGYIAVKSELDDKRVKMIPLWIFCLPLLYSFIEILLNEPKDLTLGLKPLILWATVFALTRYFFRHAEFFRKNLTVRKIRLLEISGMIMYAIFFISMSLNFLKALENNDRRILVFFPEPYNKQMEKLMDDNQIAQEKTIILHGEHIVHQLSSRYYFMGEYPETLIDDEFMQIEQRQNERVMEVIGKRHIIIDYDDFFYSASLDRQSYKLCTELSSGQKCWENNPNEVTLAPN